MNGIHWALLFVSIQDQTVVYIDPMGTTKDKSDSVCKSFAKFAETSKNLKNFKFTTKFIEHQLQKDTYNCGTFVCYFFEILLKKNDFLFTKRIDINLYRQEIKNKITQSSELKICCVCLTEQKRNKLFTFTANRLKKLDCNHVFHAECITFNKCIVCESLKT